MVHEGMVHGGGYKSLFLRYVLFELPHLSWYQFSSMLISVHWSKFSELEVLICCFLSFLLLFMFLHWWSIQFMECSYAPSVGRQVLCPLPYIDCCFAKTELFFHISTLACVMTNALVIWRVSFWLSETNLLCLPCRQSLISSHCIKFLAPKCQHYSCILL